MLWARTPVLLYCFAHSIQAGPWECWQVAPVPFPPSLWVLLVGHCTVLQAHCIRPFLGLEAAAVLLLEVGPRD